jgi:hypothetical protein
MIEDPYHEAGIVKTVFLMEVYGVLSLYAGFAAMSWVAGSWMMAGWWSAPKCEGNRLIDRKEEKGSGRSKRIKGSMGLMGN